jgi:hypothetical protein
MWTGGISLNILSQLDFLVETERVPLEERTLVLGLLVISINVIFQLIKTIALFLWRNIWFKILLELSGRLLLIVGFVISSGQTQE